MASSVFTGRSNAVNLHDLELLRVCRSFASLDDHAFRACLALNVSPDHATVLRQHLERLASVGLLTSREQVEELLRDSSGQRSEPISVVGIPTRDRPALLARCVSNLVRSVQNRHQPIDIVVCDGSDDPAVQARNRAVLADVRGEGIQGVRYVGHPERERFVERLIAAGADPAATRFALIPDPRFGFAAGANRNLLALAAAGRVMLQTDDDVLCRASALPNATGGLALSSGSDPTEFWFPESVGPPPDTPVDVAGLHEALLGRGVGDCVASLLGSEADLDGAEATFYTRLRIAGGRVRVTTPGVAGDSGMGVGLYPLILKGPSRVRLHESAATYTGMLSHRHLLRGVARPTVTAGSVCVGLNLGLDLRTPLPPFPPAGRNEDGVFGFVTQTCCPAAFMGHLPAAVWHLPDGDRRRSPDAFLARADGPRSDQLLLHVIRTCCPKLPSPVERRNLRILGEGLMGLGDLSADGFWSVVRAASWEIAATTTATLSDLLTEYGGEPEWWAADIRRLLHRFGEKATAEWYGVPPDLLSDGSSPQDALALFQEFVRNYGHLLLHWHDVADAAKGVRLD